MNTLRPLLLFAVKFLLIYILLIVLANTTDFQKTYRNIYVIAASMVANTVYEQADIKCEKLEDNKSEDDIQFTFANKLTIEKAKEEARQTGQIKTSITGFKWSFNTYRVDLMFLLFFIALILAYSSDWKHKIKGLLFGLLIYYVITLLLFYGRVLFQINNNDNVFPECNLSNFGEQVLSTATNMHTEGMFFIVLLLWGTLMIRRKDFMELSKK